MARNRPVTPPHERPTLLILASLLTIAVPGVGHIYAQFLTRGAIWLAGNLLMMAILLNGSVARGTVFAIFGVYRLAATIDVVALCQSRARNAEGGGAEGGR